MGFHTMHKKVSNILVTFGIFAGVEAVRRGKHANSTHAVYMGVQNWVSIRPDLNVTSDFACTPDVTHHPGKPGKLLAVDGGGTQVKVLLLPDDWPKDGKIKNVAQLSQCTTTEKTLKDMLKSKQLEIPKPFLPVTGGLGERMRREEAFKHIITPVNEFEAIARGTVSEHVNGGFENFIPEKSDVPAPGRGDPEPGITMAIYVDTTTGKIYRGAWNVKGERVEVTPLTKLHMDLVLFKANFKQLLERSQSFSDMVSKLGEEHAEWTIERRKKDAEWTILKGAAAMSIDRLKLNKKEAELRDEKAKIEEEARLREERRRKTPLKKEEEARLREVETGLANIYAKFETNETMKLVPKAHKLIKEIYPKGIGKLGPYAAACFMARARSCHPRKEHSAQEVVNLQHYAMGFLEMLVVNTIQVAELWKGILELKKVVYVGALVNTEHVYGQVSREFFKFRMSRQIKHGIVELDDLQALTPIKRFREYLKDVPMVSRESYRYARSTLPGNTSSFTIASLGTGVPIVKVEPAAGGDISIKRVGGSAVGGGTFWGLMKAAYPDINDNDFRKVVTAAIGGHDKLGSDAQRMVVRVAGNIAEVVSLITLNTGLDTVACIGGFLKWNLRARGVITHICASFGVKTMFEIEGPVEVEASQGKSKQAQRECGYTGAFGALLHLLRLRGDAAPKFEEMP